MDKPFDRALRRRRRDRAAHHGGDADYLHRMAADELLARLEGVKRTFRNALDLGCAEGYLTARLRERGVQVTPCDAGAVFAARAGGIHCEEDRLPFAAGAFDLVVSVGVLDTVNDLPGALTLIRRALRPDGLFMAAFAGAGSLPRLRSAMAAADAVNGGAAARIHPQIDVRAAGDLLGRAGFVLQVADSDRVRLRYPSLQRLIGDLRGAAATNVLAGRAPQSIGRRGLAAAIADFEAHAEADGKTAETLEVVYLTGWAPGPDQPQPARRGSGTTSLAATLGTG